MAPDDGAQGSGDRSLDINGPSWKGTEKNEEKGVGREFWPGAVVGRCTAVRALTVIGADMRRIVLHD
ncbi:unnamed protein product [Arctogadus glacialis]